MVNKMPDSYYLLIKATDNYGNNINAVGTRESKIMVDVTGSALVSLDKALENGVETKETISPIAVDGVSYLTYPLKASKVKSGEINITIQGGTVRQVIKKMVTDGSKLSAFFLTGTIAYVGQDNIIPFVMYTSSGTAIKEYGELLHYLGITDKDPMGIKAQPSQSGEILLLKRQKFTICRISMYS